MNEESIAPSLEAITESSVATPPTQPPVPPANTDGGQPSTRKVQIIAWVALGIGIFALVLAVIPFVTFGSGLFILAGLIVSIIALAKARGPKGAAITGLILSLVAVPAAIVMTIVSIGLIGAAATTTLQSTLIEQQIASGISDQLGIDATVACPDSMTGSKGSTFECVATDPNGDSVIVDITVIDSVGGVTWKVRT